MFAALSLNDDEKDDDDVYNNNIIILAKPLAVTGRKEEKIT